MRLVGCGVEWGKSGRKDGGTDLCMMLYPQKVIYEKRGVSYSGTHS